MSFCGVSTITRDISLLLMGAIIFFSLQFAVFFIYKWINGPYRKISNLRFSWSIVLLVIAVNIWIYTIANFYACNATRQLFLSIGDVTLIIGLAFFANIQERAISRKTRNVFLLIGIFAAVLFLLKIEPWASILRNYVIFELYDILFIIFSITLIRRSRERLKLISGLFLAGYVLGVSGYLLLDNIMKNVESWDSYPLAAGLILFGITIVSISVNKLPSLRELNWAEKVREVFLVHESGIPLFHIDLTKVQESNKVKTEEILKGSAITSINIITQAITKSRKKIRTITQNNVKILFGHKESLTFAVVVEEELDIIHYKINQFLKEFFKIYKAVPRNIYKRSVFEPARAIALRIFAPREARGGRQE